MFISKITLLVATLAASAPMMASSAGAEPGPIGKWLMEQPLTVWDIGMTKAGDQAKRARDGMPTKSGMPEFAWAKYDWDNNEIDIHLSIWNYRGEMTHEKCNELRGSFLDGLGLYPRSFGEDDWREGILSRIRQWFSHEGFQNKSRDENLAEKMSTIIFVQVKMSKGGGAGISCRDRILTLDAPSKPVSVRAADQSRR